MSDPAGPLRTALKSWIEADAGVIAAFAGKTVKVFEIVPIANEKTPYVHIAGLDGSDSLADCLDNAEVDVTVDVWSLTDPPGYAECERIAKAVKAALAACEDTGDSPGFSVAGHRVVTAVPQSTRYLIDRNGKTAHGVVRVAMAIDEV